ncbi:GNAT family N-acetyltransferase [Nitrospirillum sp. BR 11828]|uniref:GNAT family N-acetyltransferase n=1 Tax=Nitrospirillum sp. BR 11828 TaxID=3104325 RepID=UPI002ACAEB72|nr:GNAT family N-acetyltransferase [Nitrospirillum sp. BR 11828]MDZ5647460.1 GNAT family N-acetyltransferase [Nitrospirillum sp. BR 11828]
MTAPDPGLRSLRVEVLGPHHDRRPFASGVEVLDRYFQTQIGQDARKNIAAPFVLVLPDGTVAGYYTLSATSLQLADLPPETARKLPRYPLVPATLLGRLAVDKRHHGHGYGGYLLADALHRCLRSEIASFAVLVDAYDDNARRFYERMSFLPLPDTPRRLFRPLADIAPLFQESGT